MLAFVADDLLAARSRIDAIDKEILHLIQQRLEAVDAVRAAKSEASPLDPTREHEVLARLQQGSIIEDGDVEAIFRAIMGASLRKQGGLRVAFLGPEGTWSHRAVQARFGRGAEAVPCSDLDRVVEAFVAGDVGHAVVPVQNSATGPILEGLRLVQGSPVSVVGRMDLTVTQGLVGPEGPIKVVHSHPQALAQARHALRSLAPDAKWVSSASTAQAVQDAQRLREHAVADAKFAASLGFNVHVEALATSQTRFLVLGHEATCATGRDRTLLVLRVRDEPGSLTQALNVLSKEGVDLRWVQAMPCPDGFAGTEFMMELAGHREEPRMSTALGALHGQAIALRILGSYPVLEA